MAFPRPSSPRVLWADIRAFAKERSRHQWIAAAAAIVMPAIMLTGFYLDSKDDILPDEQIIYAKSWSANRTDEEIIAQQKIDQQKRAEWQKKRQAEFKKLQDRLGIE